MDSYGAGSAPEDEQYVPASLARELERENTRLQMELDASCNAEELRQYRHANQFLITNQGAYERENALLRDALRECLDGIAYSISHNTMLLPISYTPPAYLEKLARHRSLLPDAVDVCPDSALPNA
jgi:hypothetical protein